MGVAGDLKKGDSLSEPSSAIMSEMAVVMSFQSWLGVGLGTGSAFGLGVVRLLGVGLGWGRVGARLRGRVRARGWG